MSIPVDCSECGHRFEVASSLGGGLTNCPVCKKAVKVTGGPEPLFILIVSVSILAGLLGSAAAFLVGGPIVGGIVTAVIVVIAIVSLFCL